jgi:hypothetical protein
MKKNILLISAIALTSTTLLFNSCKKDDTTAPVVTLSGSSSSTIPINGSFSDPGATATDNEDGTLTPTVSGSVDVTTEGTYTLTYSATDAAGNTGTATRTVTIVIVRDSYVGTYNVTGTLDGTTETPYGTPIVASSANSDRIIINNFAGVSGSNVYANVDGHSVTIPSQTYNDGTFTYTVSGTGSINNKAKLMTLNWTASVGSTSIVGVETYTKQ